MIGTHKKDYEDHSEGFAEITEDDRKGLEEEKIRLKEKILRLKRRELYRKYVSLTITSMFAALFAAQLAYSCFGSTLPSSPLIAYMLLATALFSFCSTIFSIVDSKKNKRLKKELENLEGNDGNVAQLKKSDRTSAMDNCLKLAVMGIVIFSALGDLRDTVKALDASDYFSLTLGVLDIIGEFAGDEILLVGSILSFIASGVALYGAFGGDKGSRESHDVMAAGLIFVGSLALLSRRIMLMTSEVPLGATAPAIGLIGIACIMVGCAINICSYRSKLDNLTIDKGISKLKGDSNVGPSLGSGDITSGI
ncbi:MAG: hypothetical protein QWI36_01600 [Wolbachia endosymbiont of Tyrophagus putrescentiae]|nr:hypothetical protein [Wolbachia endosymbiont of Tyrophagus putrescentiae]